MADPRPLVPAARRPRPIRRRATCAAALLAGLAGLAGCGAQPDAAAAAGETPTTAAGSSALPVRVATVGGGAIVEALAAQGRLEAYRRELISTRSPGFIAELPVLDGELVAAESPIVRLIMAPDDVEAGAKAALTLQRAKRDLDRREALAKRAPDLLSASELDAARDLVADARLEVEVRTRMQRDMELRAPFAGVLSNRAGVVGQQVPAGFQVAELHDTSRFRLHLDMPETSLRRLTLGQEVGVTALSDGTSAAGAIAVLPGAIDPTKGTGRVIVDIAMPPAAWRPGGFVTARLLLGQVAADRVLPRDAVLYRQNKAYAWLVEDHEGQLIARKAWLELGAGDNATVQVTSGLTVGDRVVVEGMVGLTDGIPVSVRE